MLLVASAVCVGSGRARDEGWGDRWGVGVRGCLCGVLGVRGEGFGGEGFRDVCGGWGGGTSVHCAQARCN